MSLAAGEVFAGYTVVRRLGSGAVGEVYLAKHPRLARQDAIKVLSASASADEGFRARFEREADLAATLRHPHIVGVHDRGDYQGLLWIAMDFVDGSDAARLMRDRYPNGMPADEVLDVVTAIADALDYAHERQLVHRDVKPANILLTEAPRRRILLTDFGIPRRSGDADGRDDQYALAATAYHLLSGAPPVEHAPGHVRPELAAFDPAISRALTKDPSERFDTCLDFANALRNGPADVANTVASPIPPIDEPTAHFESPATGPKQPVFVPAWSQEPAPNPYLDPPDDPYPDPSHAPTMAAMRVPDSSQHPPPAPPLRHVEHPSGPTGRTWAMAGVAAVIVLVIVLAIVVARGGSEEEAQPSTRPQFSNSEQRPPPPETSSEPSTAAPTGTEHRRVRPPAVAGPDGKGESCRDGYQITGQAGWASHGVRGSPAATCVFVGSVLKAYWDAAEPSDALRTVIAAGAIPCSDGAQCAGDEFVVSCAVEGADPWITCRGGRGAVVYLY